MHNSPVDVVKWKRFPRYWPFAKGIHRSPQDDDHLSIFWWLVGWWDSILLPSLIKIIFIIINLHSIHYSILRSEGSSWHWTARTAGLLHVWAITLHNYRLNQAKLWHYIAIFYHPGPCICIIHHVRFRVWTIVSMYWNYRKCRSFWLCIWNDYKHNIF